MVTIAPFRALRYAKGHDLAKLTSPPHDVITDEEAAEMRKTPEHIANLILPAGDGMEKYEAARRNMQELIENGVLVRDDAPGYYLYELTHMVDGELRTMRGLFARIALDPTYQHIKRHEFTLKKKKRDRFHLQQATKANLESIWLLYRDERAWVEELMTSNAYEELLRFTDEAGAEHCVYKVTRTEAVVEITAQFEDRDVVIADGHHRYQTALDIYAEDPTEGNASLLVCLVRDTSPAVRIEPTHRLLFDLDLDLEQVLEQAKKSWIVEPLDETGPDALRALVDEDPTTCVLLAQDPALQAHHLRLKPEVQAAESSALDRLTVQRVHTHLLEALGASPVEDHVHYTRTAKEAVDAVHEGKYPYAVMLTGESNESVFDVTAEGNLMPQKSTFYIPKLRSGLVLAPSDEARPKSWQELGGDGGKMRFDLPDLS